MATAFSMDTLPNRFNFQEAEERIYARWEANGYFNSDPDPAREPFTIVIPPPNVTGALHLGHALNNTLQDILIRFRRMQGYNTLWLPGTDHAGIGTQAVVERRLLADEGKTRHDLGREQLVQRIWQWKEQYESRILGQLKQLGASCDWRRTRFTFDDVCARAVRHTFFDLFRKKLIYRGKRLVNWDTTLQTAVSDDEVFHETIQGHFWHFRYPLVDPRPGEPTHVTIATTRPETMLGDTAVAVHPDPTAALQACSEQLQRKLAEVSSKDRAAAERQIADLQQRRAELLPDLLRLRDLAVAGRMVRLPLVEREIPLVMDEWARPEMGSGCVKITPAHDPNDYELALRRNLPMVNVLHPDGTMNANAGKYEGLSISEARKRVVEDLDRLGLLVQVEDREIDLAHSDRSNTPIEPYLADQWFVRMDRLAQSAMDAVIDGRVEMIPSRYARGYLDWLAEKRDWPVSRQLWWGHRIPIWSRGCATAGQARALVDQLRKLPACQEGRISVDIEERAAGDELATVHVCIDQQDADLEAQVVALGYTQDEDVLDTWFSSALWPHSTLGWPDKTPELAYYYPTSTLITSRDIITLWVARMVLAGLNNVGDVPFRQVFIHPKILDGYGETMSKSKGNGVDPLDVIQKFGADALRFGLAYLTTETQDIRMPVQYECPHCSALIDQTKENRQLPRLTCTNCDRDFSTQWAEAPADLQLPRGAVVSERFELARNFGNKLWNASRFVMLNLHGYVAKRIDPEQFQLEDRWILSRLATVTGEVTRYLDLYAYADAARVVYGFAWDEFCSFYIEMLKGRLSAKGQRHVAQSGLAHTLDVLLRLLHPLMPFLTEEVWQLLGRVAPRRGVPEAVLAAESVMVAPWPVPEAGDQDELVEQQFARFQAILGVLRDIRNRQGIAPKEHLEFCVRCEEEWARLFAPMESYFAALAKARSTGFGPRVEAPATSAHATVNGMDVYVDLKEMIDVDAELARLKKQHAKLQNMIALKRRKLADADFVQRAPVQIVERERNGLAGLLEQLKSIEAGLAKLGDRS
jgi:valyl-tRNA synthetase